MKRTTVHAGPGPSSLRPGSGQASQRTGPSTSLRTGFGAERRAREKASKEAALLDAAERVIGRSGFHGAGMAEIAREAEYAIGTLYKVFASKEALYERLLVTRAEEITRGIRGALDGDGRVRDRLERVLEAKVAFFARHLDFIKIYASTSIVATATWGLPAAVRKLRDENVRRIAEAVAEAKTSAELRSDADPRDVALAFQAVTQAFLLAAAQDPAGFRGERVHESTRRVFFDPLFGPRACA